MKDLNPPLRSPCPVATSMDLLGDSWTLVIVRDMLNGKSRFNEFLDSPERITATVLTKRLEMMLRNGLVSRKAYKQHPPRYRYVLTKKGAALGPVLLSFCEWANEFYPKTWDTPEGFGSQKELLK